MRNSDNIFNKIKRGLDNVERANNEIDRAKREIRRGFNHVNDIYRLAELSSINLEKFLRLTPRRIIPASGMIRKSLSFRELVKEYNIKLPKIDKKNRRIFLKLEKNFYKIGCIICGYTNNSSNARHCQRCGNRLLISRTTGNYDEICKGLELFLEDNNVDSSYHLDLASIYYNKGLYKKASKQYKKFIEKNPNEEIVWIYLGLCYLKLNKYDKAVKSFSSTKNSNYFYSSLLGLSYIYDGQLEEGKKLCNDILHKNLEDKLILSNLSTSYAILGEYEFAIDLAHKAIDLDYDFDITWDILGVAYMYNGEYLDAFDCFLKSLNRNISYSPAWKNLGIIFETLDDYRNASDAFFRSIDSEPNDFETWYYLSRTFFKNKELSKAYEAIKISLKLKPDVHYSLDLNDLILRSHKRFEKDYKKWYSLAKRYYNSNNLKKAQECTGKCLEINPQFENAENLREKIENKIVSI